MMEDEVVREVRAAREAFAAKYGYDVRSMVAALQAMDAAGDRKVVRLEPRRPAASDLDPADNSHPKRTEAVPAGDFPPSVTEVGPAR